MLFCFDLSAELFVVLLLLICFFSLLFEEHPGLGGIGGGLLCEVVAVGQEAPYCYEGR